MPNTKPEEEKSAFWKDKGTLIELTAMTFGLVLVILTIVGLLNLH